MTTNKSVSAMFEKWQRPDQIRLSAGELTSAELAAVVAVVSAIEREVNNAIAPIQIDADRYRWLIVNSGFTIADMLFGRETNTRRPLFKLDAAIDAARAQDDKN